MVAHADQRTVRGQLDRGAGRVRDRVLEQDVEDPVQVAVMACHRQPGLRPGAARQLTARRSGRRRRSARRRARTAAAGSLVAATRLPSPARLSSSSSVTISRQAVDLAEGRVEVLDLHRGDRLGARLLEAQPQSRQRGAELVRGVGHELPLSRQQRREALGHPVEGPRELLLLGAALDPRADAEVAARDAFGGLVESQDRPGDLPRDDRSGEQPERQHEPADQPDRKPRAADRPVHGRDALRDPHRAGGPARPGQHRHRRREDLLAERLRRAAHLGDVARERRGDLRTAAVRAAARARRRRSRPASARRARRSRPGRAPRARRAGPVRRGPPPAADRSAATARAATISACERDCSFTSASTRSRRLSPSGTSSATIASTST